MLCALRRAGIVLALAAVMRSQTLEAISRAIYAFQHNDPASAERILDDYLKVQPQDGTALGFLAVVLDQEGKHAGADQAYRRALALDRSPGLLNNYGNHLLVLGKKAEARQAFLQVLAMDPKHSNALVQLAKIALEEKAPTVALGYLQRLPPNANDPHQDFELGVALAAGGQYSKAETYFGRTLVKDPDNFEALYDLGLAASHARHNQKAREVLEQALRKQPENAKLLYDLAAVDSTLGDKESALQLLVRARQAAPERPEVESLLAHTAARLGYFGDAITAWDAYLKLKPQDDEARRERAFAESAIGVNRENALTELRAFVLKHPRDAVGQYELGTAEGPHTPDKALIELNRAIALDPNLMAARVARGIALYRVGKMDAALVDFQFAAEREPKNATILDHLGETCLALNRPEDALVALRKAVAISPANSSVLFHLGRALTTLGKQQEAAAVFARYRETGASKAGLAHPAGLVKFLSLPPEEQLARYREGVERTVKHDPHNIEAQMRWLELLLQNGNASEAAVACQNIASLKPAAGVIREVAGQLLSADQYALANDFLKTTAPDGPGAEPELQLYRALTAFHISGASAELAKLDQVPAASRTGDYYLARFQALAALGQSSDADTALEQAIAAAPKRAELYRQTALQLIANRQFARALSLLDQADRNVPEDPVLDAIKGVALELTGKNSYGVFEHIESQWPEWAAGWISHAMVLTARQQSTAAQHCLEVAAQLGGPEALIAYCRNGGHSATSGREQEARNEFLAHGLGLLFP